MPEIEAIPWNGLNVVSTFSGAGGSCLGYRMAGYKVLWASEFIPAAQEVYRLNHPTSILDTRDIRTVQPQDILDAIGLGVGDIDILDGSPPCASFSVSGNRQQDWGKEKKYSQSTQRTDDLFDEYIRLLQGLQPKVFVAENVKGLVMGMAKGYFLSILKNMKLAGYTVKAKVLNARYLGVPQRRERVIFIGVRNDLDQSPVYPEPLPYGYTVQDSIGDLELNDNDVVRWLGEGKTKELYGHTHKQILGKGQLADSHKKRYGTKAFFNYRRAYWVDVAPTCMQGTANILHPDQPRALSIREVKRICSFPDDFQLTGSFVQQWERVGRAVPPVMMRHIAHAIEQGIFQKCVA
jgi:DNA (cytosine-5)-methyltransferase 1